MAVTVVNAGPIQPLVGQEVVVANLAGGPFDNIDVYVSGGTNPSGGASQEMRFRLYATVGALSSIVSEAAYTAGQGGTGALLTWPTNSALPGLLGQTGPTVHAGGTAYILTVFTPNLTGFVQSNPNTIAATVAAVQASDVVADTNSAATVLVPASGSIQVTTANGYVPFADVGALLAGLPACTFRLFANCGVGSVEAQIANGGSGAGSSLSNAILREVVLPVATQYRLTVEFTTPNGATANCTASLSTYENATGGGGGGAVVLNPEVTGPSNANVVSGPFSTASLAWQAGVLAPKWTQLISAAGAGQPLTVAAQAAQVGTNTAGGQLVLGSGAVDGAASPLGVLVKDGATAALLVGTGYTLPFGSAIWLNGAIAAPTNVNYFVTSDGTSFVFVNAPTGQRLDLGVGANLVLRITTLLADFVRDIQLDSDNFTFGTAVATPAISQAISAGAAAVMRITAQAAGGGANDGGPLALSGGAASGASVDGSVIVGTPMNMGQLTKAVVAGANNLTIAESDPNVFIFTGALAGGPTVTLQRRIADTSLVFVRNNTNQTLIVSYLAGGTVNLVTLTSGLICSDGANLQVIMAGT